MADISAKQGIPSPTVEQRVSEKTLDSDSDHASRSSQTDTKAEPEIEYAHGFKLAILVAAALSSVFLMSLDQVSSLQPTSPHTLTSVPSDDSRYSHSKDYCRIWWTGRRWLVRCGLFHDFRWDAACCW